MGLQRTTTAAGGGIRGAAGEAGPVGTAGRLGDALRVLAATTAAAAGAGAGPPRVDVLSERVVAAAAAGRRGVAGEGIPDGFCARATGGGVRAAGRWVVVVVASSSRVAQRSRGYRRACCVAADTLPFREAGFILAAASLATVVLRRDEQQKTWGLCTATSHERFLLLEC